MLILWPPPLLLGHRLESVYTYFNVVVITSFKRSNSFLSFFFKVVLLRVKLVTACGQD